MATTSRINGVAYHVSGAITFHGDAHDAAANAWRAIETYCVRVLPVDTERAPFDAIVNGVEVDETTGQYVAILAPADADGFAAEGAEPIRLDIYEGIQRVEVY